MVRLRVQLPAQGLLAARLLEGLPAAQQGELPAAQQGELPAAAQRGSGSR